MQRLSASRGALGEGMVVVNEGPDAYVMEDNRIRLEPGEALACVGVAEMWQGGGTILYRMTKEEAETWASDVHNAPIRLEAGRPSLDKKRRVFHVTTRGTEFRASVEWEEECDLPETFRKSQRRNFLWESSQ